MSCLSNRDKKTFPEEWPSTRCSKDCFQPPGTVNKNHVTHSGLVTRTRVTQLTSLDPRDLLE